ncbi:MAG: 50S ribosomal protein L17 [bacterium]
MRHRKKEYKLGRNTAHRQATLVNLAIALFKYKHIKTTVAKAKAARVFSEKLITLAKKPSVHTRRVALRKLKNKKKAIKILFDDIAPQYADRPGGYTRVVKLGSRLGDNADMAILELVGYDMAKKKKEKAKEKEEKKEEEEKKKRLRGGK